MDKKLQKMQQQIKQAYVLGFKNQCKILGASKEQVPELTKIASAHFDKVGNRYTQKVASCKDAIREALASLK